MTADEFAEIVREHALLLFPLYTLQQRVRRIAGGQAFWKRIIQARPDGQTELERLKLVKHQTSTDCPEMKEKKASRPRTHSDTSEHHVLPANI